MDRRLILLGSYLALLPVATLILVGCLLISLHKNFEKPQSIAHASVHTQAKIVLASAQQPEVEKVLGTTTDSRVTALEEFFSRYRSPLLPYSQKLVDVADKYSLDWRLLPAIAMQESTLCQRIPKNSFNCWGYGIYGGKVKRFPDFNTAIETVSQTLSEKYKDKHGLEGPKEIVTRYTPANTNDWSGQVSYVMERISSSL